jgi:mannosyltransferase
VLNAAKHAHPTTVGHAAESDGRAWDWIVLLLMAAGTVLRLLALGQQSYWVDEIRSVLIARGGDAHEWGYAVWNIHGPLHLVLLRLWMMLFGEGEAATRVLSVIFGVASFPLFYRAALPIIGARAARFALALLVFSPFHLWYSQETRNYAMLFDVTLLAVPLYLAEIERQSRGSLLAALAISVVGCLTNLAGFFLLGIYGLMALTLGRAHRYPLIRVIALGLLTAVFVSPWVIRAATQMGTPKLGRSGLPGDAIVRGESPPGLQSVPFTFYIFSLGLSSGPSIHELKQDRWQALKPFLLYLSFAMTLFMGLAAYGAWALRRRGRAAPLLGIWMIVPLVLMAGFSLFNLKAPNARYALASFGPFLMLLGLGVAGIRSRWARALALALLLAVAARADWDYFTNPRYWRPDGRSIGALLTAEQRPGDLVISFGVPEPLEYYAPAGLPVVPHPALESLARKGSAGEWLARTTTGWQRIWYVKIDSFWGDPKFRLLNACNELLIPDGRWEFEKALVARFIVPQDSAAAAGQRAR